MITCLSQLLAKGWLHCSTQALTQSSVLLTRFFCISLKKESLFTWAFYNGLTAESRVKPISSLTGQQGKLSGYLLNKSTSGTKQLQRYTFI
jgi:hypothetical protein